MPHVLVVEDERPLREAWVEGLREEGFDSVGFERADEALKAMELRLGSRDRFHFAVLDLQLTTSPEPYKSDRWALAHELRRRDPDLLILLVTGVFTREIDWIIGNGVAHGYLIKGTLTTGILAAEVHTRLRIRGVNSDESRYKLRPIFRFEHPDHIGEDKAFTLDTARITLNAPSGAELKLRNSDLWLLEMFVRKPNEILLYGNLPFEVVPRRRPSKFQNDATEPLAQAISRIGREINPLLGSPSSKFFANVQGEGYIFNAEVHVATQK